MAQRRGQYAFAGTSLAEMTDYVRSTTGSRVAKVALGIGRPGPRPQVDRVQDTATVEQTLNLQRPTRSAQQKYSRFEQARHCFYRPGGAGKTTLIDELLAF
jgi:hypothetical protein